MRSFLALLPILLSLARCSDFPPPREPYTLSWTGGPFVWPSSTVRFMYKSLGKFIPENMIATRAALFRDDLFVVFPRYLPGIPVTLARTSMLSPNYEAVFEPFPSWEAQTEGGSDALQNAADLFLDRKDVLWVLDTGVTLTLDNPVSQRGPRAFGFDVITGRQKYKVDLSPFSSNSSRLQYIVVDFDSKDRRYLYVSDASGALLVYNVEDDSGYRVNLPDTTYAGCTESPDVLYLSLVKSKTGGRQIFLSYLCGNNFFSVRSEDLQSGSTGDVVRVPGRKSQKVVVVGSDRNTIYFRYEGQGDIYSWDVDTEFTKENFSLVHEGDCCLLATQAVLDPIRGKMRLLLSNFLDYLRQTVGVGAFHVFTSL